MKRLLSIVLSLCMLFSITAGLDFTASADEKQFGIDISEHNRDFDIAQQKENGNSFVMIRLGYFTYTDKYFFSNVERAVEAEMNFGVYLYSYAFDDEEARQEADFVLKTLNELPSEYLSYMTLPVAYDLEETKILQNCSKTQITKQMTIFCNAIRDGGFTPMVYANQNWFTNYIDIKTAYENNYKLWYAYYPSSQPDFEDVVEIGKTGYSADMWQYSTTNDTMDKNIMYPSMKCDEHIYEKSIIKPTCTDKGYVLNTCTECGQFYKSDYTNALNHNWSNGVVTTAPTCAKAGVKTSTCIVCNEPKTETISATGNHTYKNVVTSKATQSANGNIAKKCSVCGKVSKNTTIYKISSIKLNYSTLTYNGQTRNIGVTIKDSKGNTLVKDKDYTVKWDSGRKNVGKYACKITFKGNYSGSKTLYLTINPKGTSVSSVSAGSKNFTVKWSKQTTQTTGYQIQYATDSKFTKNCKTVTVSKNSTTSKKVTGLTGKKKYYVRVRTYKQMSSGNKYYSGWSGYKTVTTKK